MARCVVLVALSGLTGTGAITSASLRKHGAWRQACTAQPGTGCAGNLEGGFGDVEIEVSGRRTSEEQHDDGGDGGAFNGCRRLPVR